MRRHRTGQGVRFTSVAIGDDRIKNLDAFTEDKRTALEGEERSLLNASSDMMAKAVFGAATA
jgi:hypothetical protein